MTRFIDDALAGSGAGFLATAPMSITMALLHRLAPPPHHWRRLPPGKVAMDIAAKLGLRKYMRRRHRKLVSAASHLGYGAGAGAVYGPIAQRLPGSPWLKGSLFGLGVWAASSSGRRSTTIPGVSTTFSANSAIFRRRF